MNLDNPDITVVVLTYNRAGMLRQALATLVNQVTDDQFSFEILVVDDGSTDNTTAVVREVSESAGALLVRYLYKDHGGEGDSRNKGVAAALGQWVVFCDDDQLADPRWLAELYQIARETGARCVDGAVYLKLPQRSSFELTPKVRRIFGEKTPQGYGPYSTRDTVGAGNILIHKSLFNHVGGFDPTFRQGVDTDFFWRVEKQGIKIRFAPQARIHHIIPHLRLNFPYLRESCLRQGFAYARLLLKYEGPGRLALAGSWRMAVALGRDLPLMLGGGFCTSPPG
ncbi:MAG: glycosyltransferase family 2 protein [Deltaproteobacteria bacterium]|nr:glycosyltransferase family 2 protein [Deltaproteobacteria bacterium]